MLVLVLAIVVSLCVGIVSGGTISNLSRTRLRFLPFVFLAVFVQVLIFSPILGYEPIIHRIGPYIHIATLVVSAGVMLMNRHIPGMKLIFAGAALNLLVITVNGGFMPISESALRIAGMEEEMLHHQPKHDTEDYILANSRLSDGEAHLLFLGDSIPVPKELPLSTIISIGDVILALGASVAIITCMRAREEYEHDEDEAALVLHKNTR